MDVGIRRIWWAVGLVSLVFLLIATGLVVQARMQADAPPPADVNANANARGGAAAAPRATAGAADKRATLPAPVQGAVSPAAVVVAAARGARQVEVCGVGPVPLAAAASEDDNQLHIEETLAQAPVPWADMQASADERIRAAGFALSQDIEEMVKLASRTRDAQVYAIAQTACRALGTSLGTSLGSSAGSAGGTSLGAVASAADKAWCETLTNAQRVVLEPDNAAAWIMAAGDAVERNDPASADDALRRAAVAPVLSHHAMAVVAQVERHAAAGSTAANGALWVQRALQDSGQHSAVMPLSLCSERSLGTRREACQQLAQRLLDRPDTLADLALGLSLGRQVGVDDSLLVRKRAELDAVQAADHVRAQRWEGDNRYSCAALAGKREWLRKVQAQGEWRVSRDAAVSQVGSMDALVRRHQDTASRQGDDVQAPPPASR